MIEKIIRMYEHKDFENLEAIQTLLKALDSKFEDEPAGKQNK